jgi:uncharacterized protein YciI
MKAMLNIREMIARGRQLEQAGQLAEAAVAYQKVVNDDGANQEAVGRLLILYRKLKEYGKELAVINGTLAAYKQRDKALQEKWIKDHPNAAGAGKAIFRTLGGLGMPGADSTVESLLKRKGLVERRAAGGKGKKRAVVKPIATAAARKKEERDRKAALAAQRREEAQTRRDAAAEKKRKEARERKEEKAAARQQAVEQRRQEAATRKAPPHPSLFVVSFRYLAPLEEIHAAMARHRAFLDKHYKQGDFLVSGRQIPHTGGIIITRGKNRATVERMMRQDPFVKGKLASVDIVEFSASQIGKGLHL